MAATLTGIINPLRIMPAALYLSCFLQLRFCILLEHLLLQNDLRWHCLTVYCTLLVAFVRSLTIADCNQNSAEGIFTLVMACAWFSMCLWNAMVSAPQVMPISYVQNNKLNTIRTFPAHVWEFDKSIMSCHRQNWYGFWMNYPSSSCYFGKTEAEDSMSSDRIAILKVWVTKCSRYRRLKLPIKQKHCTSTSQRPWHTVQIELQLRGEITDMLAMTKGFMMHGKLKCVILSVVGPNGKLRANPHIAIRDFEDVFRFCQLFAWRNATIRQLLLLVEAALASSVLLRSKADTQSTSSHALQWSRQCDLSCGLQSVEHQREISSNKYPEGFGMQGRQSGILQNPLNYLEHI